MEHYCKKSYLPKTFELITVAENNNCEASVWVYGCKVQNNETVAVVTGGFGN